MADLRIEWIQSTDDPSLGGSVASYELAREPNPNPVAVVATIAATAAQDDTTYDEAVQPGTWHYRVRAVGANGRKSLWSDEATITVAVPVTVRHEFLAVMSHETRIAALHYEPRIDAVSGQSRLMVLRYEPRNAVAPLERRVAIAGRL